MKKAYTTTELTPILNMTKQGVIFRAAREGWQSQQRPGRGGGNEWLLTSMPETTRLTIQTAEERRALEQERVALPAIQPGQLAGPARDDYYSATILDDQRRYRALAKADLVRLYLDWQRQHGATKTQKKAFIDAYLGGAWPKLLQEFGSRISWPSLERWKLEQARAGNVLALADKRGIAHKGRTNLTDQHRTIILGQILNPNAPNVAQCARQIRKRCIAEGLWEPSEPTVRRFIRAYSSECFDEYTLWREGKKAWNDKCAISLLRDWNLVQVGDVAIADGHTLNFETTNPGTGKPKRMTLLLFYDGASSHPLGWEIMATENVACISSAFRRSCLILGKFPKVVYLDNGKAFRAKFFSGCADFEQAGFLGLYRDLGCEVIHAWPYHGQSKPIERFFGTMHDLEVFIPSYTGNSISAKPARMMRGEIMHRQLYDKLGGRPLTLEETHRVIATWFAEYSLRPQPRTHLAGKTPAEIFQPGVGPGVDERRLTLMMLQKEIKTITKDGFRHLGRLYWHEALASRRHPVVIRYDDHLSPYTVFVYTFDGEFICEARDRDHYKIASGLHPAAQALGTPGQVQDLSEALALKKGQEKLAGANMQAMLDLVVQPEVKRLQANVFSLESYKKPGAETQKKLTMSAETVAAIEAIQAEPDTAMVESYKPGALCRFKDGLEKYEYLFRIRFEREIELVTEDQTWFEAFQNTPEFAKHYQRRFDQMREVFAQWRSA
ncbi:MAG: Mu transposase C-terminal domain-containing protein [Desulfarculales bacterium]|jgi:putative transposase|nr:Mu transposase C-terminal domain-containing protein [Desulfarculales bacterium]